MATRVSRWRAAGAVILAALVLGCDGPTGSTGVAGSPPPATRAGAPDTADSPAVRSARAELVRVLGTENLVLQDPQTPFRPAEGPALAAAPRAVYQVVLPDDPAKGYIVVYDFASTQAAAAAGADQAAYLAGGPGRVQTPLGTRHIIRQLGPTLVLYSWTPEGSTDERAEGIETALMTLGTAIEVPR